MTSWVVWAVAVVVAAAIGFTATHFSARTLRYVTAGIVIILLVAVTAYGQTPAGGKVPSDLETSFAFGADRLAGAWFHPLWALWSSRHAPAPGRLGWSVIAVVLLLGYRQAEKWALRRQAPQLDTAKLGDVQPSITSGGAGDGPTAGQRHDWLAAEVKFRLAAVDVYAPPILPGGTRAEGLASIAEASGVTGANLAAAILRVLGPLWPAPRRYELRVWIEGTPQEERRRARGTQSAMMAQARTALTAVGRGGAELARRAPMQPTVVLWRLRRPRPGGARARPAGPGVRGNGGRRATVAPSADRAVVDGHRGRPLRRDCQVRARPALGPRQEFRDGVCVAELLVAVKHRLNEKYLAEKAGKAEKARRGRGAGIIEKFWQRKGLQVVAAVTGDSASVRTILHKEFSVWPAPSQDSEGHDAAGWIPPTRDRVRWLPWQARTASWMAAYNTACLYAVLLQQGLATEEQVIASLRRVVSNRDSGLERPYDWISNDPDFAPLLAEDSPYPAVRAFLEDLERRDYPAGQTFEVRWPESRHPAQQAQGPASGQPSLTE